MPPFIVGLSVIVGLCALLAAPLGRSYFDRLYRGSMAAGLLLAALALSLRTPAKLKAGFVRHLFLSDQVYDMTLVSIGTACVAIPLLIITWRTSRSQVNPTWRETSTWLMLGVTGLATQQYLMQTDKCTLVVVIANFVGVLTACLWGYYGCKRLDTWVVGRKGRVSIRSGGLRGRLPHAAPGVSQLGPPD